MEDKSNLFYKITFAGLFIAVIVILSFGEKLKEKL